MDEPNMDEMSTDELIDYTDREMKKMDEKDEEGNKMTEKKAKTPKAAKPVKEKKEKKPSRIELVRKEFKAGNKDPEDIAEKCGCAVGTVKVQWYKYLKESKKK
jgi:hypothetical protein